MLAFPLSGSRHTRFFARMRFFLAVLCLAGVLPATGQTVLHTAAGSTSSDQAVTLTFASSGVVSTMSFQADGQLNGEFALSGSASTCRAGQYYSAGSTCVAHYTFTPKTPGIHRGAVVMADSSGNQLGVAYIAGQGTGAQGLFYPLMPISTAIPQTALQSGNHSTQFDVDGAGNVYTLERTTQTIVTKWTHNSDDTYTSTQIYAAYDANNNVSGTVTVDAAGNVYYPFLYFTPGYTSGSCQVYKLSPTNSGTYSRAAIWSSTNPQDCLFTLKAAPDGSIFAITFLNQLVKLTYTGTSWTSTYIGLPSIDNNNYYFQMDVDAAGDVFVASGSRATDGVRPISEFIPSASAPTGYNMVTISGFENADDPTGNGVSVGADGSIYVGQDYGVIHGVPTSTPGTFVFSTVVSNPHPAEATGHDLIEGIKVGTDGTIYLDHQYGDISRVLPVKSTDFGTVASGSQSTPAHFTLANLGTVPLALTAAAATTPFSLYADTPSSLDCGTGTSLSGLTTCELSMLFAPASNAGGPYSGVAYVYDNSLNGSNVYQAIALTGTANHPPPTITSYTPTSGDSNGGQAFVITGTALGDVSSVIFHAANGSSAYARFTINSATQITAITPNLSYTNRQTITFSVNNPGGSANGTWTYNPPASATNSTLSVAVNPIGQGNYETVVVAVKDANGNALAGATAVLNSSNQAVLSSGSQVSNSDGTAQFTLPALSAGSTKLTASVVGVALSQSVTLTVTPPVVAVGQSVSGLPTNVVMTKAGTVASVSAVTNGVAGADFNTPVSTCTGSALGAGAICAVTYTFAPTGPGLRSGAIILKDSSGAILGETLLTGTGTGPLALLNPGVQTYLTRDQPSGDALYDGAGNLFTAGFNGLYELAPNGTSTMINYDDYVGLALDGAGNMFTATDTGVYELVNATGSLVTLATFAQNAGPSGNIAADGFGNIYVPLATGSIARFAAGTLTMTTQNGVSGVTPRAVALDSAGNLFFLGGTTLYEIAAGGSSASVVTGVPTYTDGLAIDAAGNFYLGTMNGIQRLAAGTYASSTLTNGSTGGLHVDARGNILAVTGSGIISLNRSSTPSLGFTTNVGTTTGQQVVSLENDGNANLRLQSVGTYPTDFTLGGSATTCVSSTVLTPTSSACGLGVIFNPSAPGSYGGAVTIYDNSLNSTTASQSVPLTGTAYGTQTLTFAPPASPAVSGTTVTLNATASSGLPVTFTVASGIAQITGNQLTYTGSGTVSITASQPGNATYAAAPSVTQSVLVTGSATGVGGGTTLTSTLNITAAGTLAAINVLTQGAPNRDFVYATGSTDPKACTLGVTYAVGATCTVTYTFNPTRAGQRLGAITLVASGNAVLASTTISGNGVAPQALFPDATSSIAFTGSSFSGPTGVAVDGFGNVIVADQNNRVVKRINATNGVLSADSTVDVISYVNPNGTGVVFPAGIAVAGNGDIFFTSMGDGSSTGGVVLKYPAVNGVVAASTKPVTVSSGFNYPQALVFDTSGDLIVGDLMNYKVKEIVAVNGAIPASPVVTTLLSQQYPYGLAIDASGNLYVAQTNSITVITATNGQITANSPISYLTLGSTQPYFTPYGVALDGNGNLYASDPQMGVRELLAVNGVLSSSSPMLTFTNMQGRGLALDGLGHVFTADTANNAIRMNDLTGPPSISFPSTAVSATSAAVTTRIVNGGNAPLTFTGITPPASFGVDAGTTTCSTSNALSTGTLCTVGAVFAPLSKGVRGAALTLADNSGNVASIQNIFLFGTGTTGTTAQTITFAQPASPVVNGSAALALSATATSGLPVTFVVTGPATVSGTLLSITGAGTVTVTAVQAGNSTYAAAPSVVRTVVVTAAPTSYVAPETAVGSTQTLTATVTFTAAATLNSILTTAIQVTTQGIAGLDFKYAAGGTCAPGTAYVVGQACTVMYTFSPSAPGRRLGAIALYSNDASPVQAAVSFVSGLGDAPVSLFTSGGETTLATLNAPRSPVVDSVGNIFVAQQGAGTLVEFIGGSSTPKTLVSGVTGITGVTVDGAGNVFYGSPTDNKIYEVVNGSPVAIASIPNPDNNLVADGAGNLYVTSANAGLYEIAATTHAVTTVLAGGAAVPGGVLGRTVGMGIDAAGVLYLADYGSARLLSVNPSTAAVTTIASGGPWLSNPHGVTVDAAGNIYIANNDGSGSIVKFTLANGVYTPSALANSAAAQGIFATPNGDLVVVNGNSLSRYSRQTTAALNFGTTQMNAVSGTQTVGVENDGNAALNITSVSVSSNFGFGANFCTPGAVVAAGGSCSLGLTFAPLSVGALTGSVTLTSNSMGIAGSSQTVSLAGTGTQASQTIVFSTAPSLVFAPGLTATLSATASSGLPVSFSVVSGPASVGGNVLTFTGAGTVVVKASQAGNSSYAAAADVSQTIVVSPGAQTVTFAVAKSEVVFTAGGLTQTLSATASSGLPITYSVTGPATVSGSTLTITGPGSLMITATQTGSANYTASSAVGTIVIYGQVTNATAPVGTASATQTLTVAMPAAFTLNSVGTSVVPGAAGALNVLTGTGGGSCTVGHAYSAGDTCTIVVSFTPANAGLATGKVLLLDSNGTVQVSLPVVSMRFR